MITIDKLKPSDTTYYFTVSSSHNCWIIWRWRGMVAYLWISVIRQHVWSWNEEGLIIGTRWHWNHSVSTPALPNPSSRSSTGNNSGLRSLMVWKIIQIHNNYRPVNGLDTVKNFRSLVHWQDASWIILEFNCGMSVEQLLSRSHISHHLAN